MFYHPLYLHIRPHMHHIEEFGKNQIELMAKDKGLNIDQCIYMHNLANKNKAVFMLKVIGTIDEINLIDANPYFKHFTIVNRNGKNQSVWYKRDDVTYCLYLEISFSDLVEWYEELNT